MHSLAPKKIKSSILLLFALSAQAAYDTTCVAGQYLKLGYLCQFCVPGQYCQGGTRQQPGTCPTGTYSKFGDSECTVCPAGFFCATSADAPKRCSAGQGSYTGATSCVACQNGQYCTWDGIITPCQPGYFCDSTRQQRIPRLCRAGYYCDGLSETACPTGTYSLAGAEICISVQPGQFLAHAAMAPGTCPLGYSQPLTRPTLTGFSACVQCTVGHACPSITLPESDCPAGQYAPIVGMVACLVCPAGSSCSSASAYPVVCTEGSYSQGGWVQCAPCPPGYQCPGRTITGNSVTDTCAAGWYSPAGVEYCTKCPAGYQCYDPTLAPVKCALGWFSTPGSSICTICPAGSQCPDPTYFPALCPQGTNSQQGATSCVSCPKGQTCITPGASSIPCVSGKISSAFSTACMDCPAGYACPTSTFEKIVPCGPGYYSIAGSLTCEIAAAGTYAATTQLAPTTVSDRYFAEIGFTYQTRCPPGWNCLDKTGRHNVLCKPNQYTHATLGCVTCAAGTFCPVNYGLVSFFVTTGLTCDDGTWSITGMNECEICAPGAKCSTKTAIPGTCSASGATYQIGGSTTCTDCPKGHECNRGETLSPCPIFHTSTTGSGECVLCGDGKDCRLINSDPTDCGAGYYRGAADPNCTPCPRGHFCPNANNGVPTKCPAGKFANEAESVCKDCPDDYYSISGQEYCTPVPPGFSSASKGDITVCPHKTYSDWGEQSCSPCPDGFLCPRGTGYGMMQELSCPLGSFCVAGVQTLCPAGTFGAKERGISQADACADCPPGYNCVAGTEHFLLAPCPIGAYCPGGAGVSMIACPAGTTNSNLYAKSLADCITCEPGASCGSATAGPTQAAAGSCDQGYYCPQGGAYHAYPCPAGTFGGYRTGKQDLGECLICPPGNYCPSASVNPTPAPAGTYSPLSGLDDVTSLFQCPPSFYCPNTGMTNFKGYPCTAGYFCPAGSSAGNTAANSCPQGTFSDRTDLTNPLQCTLCPKGFMCGLAETSATITECAINTYCPYGTKKSSPPNCPAGTYAPYTRAMSLSDCLQCPAGKYCLSGASGVTCPAGYYCPAGTQTAQQYPCPAGYYSTDTGLTDTSQCMHCGIGKYCPTQAIAAPTPCPPGTYNDYSTTAIVCTVCPAGSYCTSANVHPQLCPMGTYSSSGQTTTTCAWCLVGTYCPLPGTSITQMNQQKCPSGTFCSRLEGGVAVGLKTYPDKRLQSAGGNACSQYKYCPRGTTTELAIPAGTAQLIYGAAYADQAVILPPGFSDSTMATGCVAGYYCPAGTISAVPCPKGTYRGNAYGKDLTDCGPCPAGYYCTNLGTANPVICPAGNFCPEGSIIPQPCPEGTYWTGLLLGVAFGLPDSKSCTPCDAGFFCQNRGQIAVDTTKICDKGFVCLGGSRRPEPTDQVTGNICPQGGWCTAGTQTVTLCLAGYIGLFQAAYNLAACVKCFPGYYCKGLGSTGATNPCPAGYVCAEGTSDYTLVKPPAGSFTGLGYEMAQKCSLGFFSKVAGATSCTSCEQGYFCNTIGLIDPGAVQAPDTKDSKCPIGYYCYSQVYNAGELPTWLGYRKYACPTGTYLDQTQKNSPSDCLPCPAKFACETTGMIAAPSTDPFKCAAGFFCFSGSPSRFPLTLVGTSYGPCPAGHWCAVGTSVPTACVAGTYSSQVGAIAITTCLPCPPGYLCATAGLTNPTTKVPAGTLSTDGITSVQFSNASGGQYAPLGAFLALRCPIGMYQTASGQGYCSYCQPGQFCMIGVLVPCPLGYWCP